MQKWSQHRTTNFADDNVARLGSLAIRGLVTEDTRPPWLAAGAEGVLRGIIAGTSEASGEAKIHVRYALSALNLQA